MSDLIAKLWQAIGRYGAEVAQDGRLAPPQYLLDAVDAVAPAAPVERGEPDKVREALVRAIKVLATTTKGVEARLDLENAIGKLNGLAAEDLADALLDLHAAPSGEAWEAFGREVLRDAHEVEGLQEIGVKHGVLVPTPVTAPCVEANGDGEHRGCVCYETDNIPGTCYRIAHPAAPQDGPQVTEAMMIRAIGETNCSASALADSINRQLAALAPQPREGR